MDEPPSTPVIVEIRHESKGRLLLLRLSDGRELVYTEEACQRCNVTAGDCISEEWLAAVDGAEQRVNAHEAALRLLSHRARSESEMRTRLKMRGFEPGAVDDEIERLRSAGLLNDAAFAHAWVEDRKRLAPRGRRMLRYELLGRGIDPKSVDLATDSIDDESTALALARERARGSALETWESFVTKVGGFLRRRGFDWEVVNRTTRSVWTEVTGRAPGRATEEFEAE
jgi:regulatory protein